MDTQTLLWISTWSFAGGGALLAVAADWARAKRRLAPKAAGLINLGSYLCLGLSMGLFVLRGFLA
jgi:hypothetical protein